METNTKLPKKHFYLIVVSCAVLIFLESLQVLMRVKNPDGYTLWQQLAVGDTSFPVYVASEMSYFLMKVLTPMMLGVYAYIAYTKMRIGQLFVFIWTVLMMGGLAYTVIEWDITSGIYYIKLATYLLSIGSILSLIRVIKEQRESIEEA